MVYESNPQYESLRFGFTNPDLQVQNLRIQKDSDLRISIFKDLFCAYSTKDSQGFVGFVITGESLKIDWIFD
jgi:hypothetical protein